MSGPSQMGIVQKDDASKHRRISSIASSANGTGQQPRASFVNRLWAMLQTPKKPEHTLYIRWLPDGKAFEVTKIDEFAKHVLPEYYKHQKFSSFVRQLNMYGWHKIQDVTSGAMNGPDETWRFENPNFIRDHEELLDKIVRNKGHKEDDDDVDLTKLFNELSVIRANQMNIEKNLTQIREDNQLLWTENMRVREQHQKHTETLDRILRFLASLYGNNLQGGNLLGDILGGGAASSAIANARNSTSPQRLLMPADPDFDAGSSAVPQAYQQMPQSPNSTALVRKANNDQHLQNIMSGFIVPSPTSNSRIQSVSSYSDAESPKVTLATPMPAITPTTAPITTIASGPVTSPLTAGPAPDTVPLPFSGMPDTSTLIPDFEIDPSATTTRLLEQHDNTNELSKTIEAQAQSLASVEEILQAFPDYTEFDVNDYIHADGDDEVEPKKRRLA